MYQKLDQIEARYEELNKELSSQEVHADSGRYQKVAKMHAELSAIVTKYREWKEIEKGIQGAKQLIAEAEDAEMKQLAHDEEHALEARRESVERELKLLLLPKDPNDEKH
ncbi:MAG TPA: PCRF domain-containing protein, partial [Terriglobia bacterium]|nr:PCRF domain-containing protein [Terriglobia bacterium]